MSATIATTSMPANWRQMLKAEYAAGIAAAMNKLATSTSNLCNPIFMGSESRELSIDKLTEMLGYNPTLHNYDPASVKPYIPSGATPEKAEEWRASSIKHNTIGDASSVFIDTYTVKIGDKEFLLIIRMVREVLCDQDMLSMRHITYLKDGLCDHEGNIVSTRVFRDDYQDASALFNDDARRKRFGDDFDPIANSAHHLVLEMINVVDRQFADMLRKQA
jgi:hypothetical protein